MYSWCKAVENLLGVAFISLSLQEWGLGHRRYSAWGSTILVPNPAQSELLVISNLRINWTWSRNWSTLKCRQLNQLWKRSDELEQIFWRRAGNISISSKTEFSLKNGDDPQGRAQMRARIIAEFNNAEENKFPHKLNRKLRTNGSALGSPRKKSRLSRVSSYKKRLSEFDIYGQLYPSPALHSSEDGGNFSNSCKPSENRSEFGQRKGHCITRCNQRARTNFCQEIDIKWGWFGD